MNRRGTGIGSIRSLVILAAAAAVVMNPSQALAEPTGARAVVSQPSLVMSLGDLYRRALESSPVMAKARLSVRQAELAYDQASRTADAIEEGHATTWDLRLLKYYDPVAASNRLEEARAALAAAEKALRLRLLELYYGVLKAGAMADAAVAAVKRSQGYLEVARARYEAGTVPRTEVLAAEVSLQSAGVDLASAENARQLALLALAQAAGIDDLADVSPSGSSADTQVRPVEPLDVSAAADRVLDLRDDVRAARNRVFEAELKYRLASDFFSPNVWSVRQAGLEVESAGTDLDMAEDSAVLDIRTSYHEMVEASQRHGMNLKALEQAEENLRLARLRYESGFGTFLEAVTAEALLKSTEASAIRSGFDLETARARFEFVMEGGRLE